ncbi:MAG: hypothetical protein COB12_12525 [Flavobacterium sp.]|nr:MAG: hypothetical protein COB12_12525 [Flavobacterium sp.]
MKIEIPDVEGYELAEGEQPRAPKKGEDFTRLGGQLYTCEHNEMVDKYIILKKKTPNYHRVQVLGASSYPVFCNDGNFVSVGALKDAMSLVTYGDLVAYGLDSEMYKTLKELIK